MNSNGVIGADVLETLESMTTILSTVKDHQKWKHIRFIDDAPLEG